MTHSIQNVFRCGTMSKNSVVDSLPLPLKEEAIIRPRFPRFHYHRRKDTPDRHDFGVMPRIIVATLIYLFASGSVGWWEAHAKGPSHIALVQTIALQILLTVALLFVIRQLVFHHVVHPLQRRADYDELTGALRAGPFWDHAEHQIQCALVAKQHIAFVFLDVDDFKQINDQYGHATGDLVLQSLGALLRKAVRHGDLVGRLGGEEFGWLMLGVTPEEALVATNRVLQSCAIQTTKGRFVVGLSGGLATADGKLGNNPTAWDLARRADRALYQAKASGKGQIHRAD